MILLHLHELGTKYSVVSNGVKMQFSSYFSMLDCKSFLPKGESHLKESGALV